MPFRTGAILALLATPTLAQSPLDSIAKGLSVSAPDMLMRAALANCIAYGTTAATQRIAAGGWAQEDDNGLTVLWLDEATIEISPLDGFCRVSSTVVSMPQAAAVAADLLTTAYGGQAVTAPDELGCDLISSDAEPADYVALSSDGNDPTCDDTGQGGSALTFYTE